MTQRLAETALEKHAVCQWKLLQFLSCLVVFRESRAEKRRTFFVCPCSHWMRHSLCSCTRYKSTSLVFRTSTQRRTTHTETQDKTRLRPRRKVRDAEHSVLCATDQVLTSAETRKTCCNSLLTSTTSHTQHADGTCTCLPV